MYAEMFIKIKGKFFVQMGQNTLNIYILHTILLYTPLEFTRRDLLHAMYVSTFVMHAVIFLSTNTEVNRKSV